MADGRRGPRCYRKPEWERVELPANECAAGLEVARRRVQSLPHDSPSSNVTDWLVAAYMQGLLDGAQIADRLKQLPAVPEATWDERMGL